MQGTESVWDYPRPPRVESSPRRIRVVHAGVTVVDTRGTMRVLETSHPPVYYIPRGAFGEGILVASATRQSFCEFKGMAAYWDLRVGDAVVRDAGWSYETPSAGYEGLAGYVAIYASKVDECWVGGEQVTAQDGDFYGGWITAELRGPFKGAAGTLGW